MQQIDGDETHSDGESAPEAFGLGPRQDNKQWCGDHAGGRYDDDRVRDPGCEVSNVPERRAGRKYDQDGPLSNSRMGTTKRRGGLRDEVLGQERE